jgi:hypothetical protein
LKLYYENIINVNTLHSQSIKLTSQLHLVPQLRMCLTSTPASIYPSISLFLKLFVVSYVYIYNNSGQLGFDSWQGKEFFSLPPCPDQLWGLPVPLSNGHWRLFPQGNVAEA